jgi:GH18 family chitinase
MLTKNQLPIIFLAFALLAGCASVTLTPTSTPTDTPTPMPTITPTPVPPFQVIAYATDAIVPEVIPFEKLTQINYSFLIPNNDGTFQPLTNGWKLKRIVDLGHATGVDVFISVGGWGWDDQFEAMAANPDNRSSFVKNLMTIVNEYNLDGVDMDWEYPDPGQSSQNFLALMKELRSALPSDKKLSTAVVAYGDENGLGILPEIFDIVDTVNIMTYDGPDHGTMSQFQAGLDYWQGRGLAKGKTVMGVPFYARPDGTPYKKIVASDPAAAQTDTFDKYGVTLSYNGIPTIEEKTKLALEHADGIMFWTLESDSLDEKLSLLNAIHNVVASSRP